MCDASYAVLLDDAVQRGRMVWSAQVGAGVEKPTDPQESVDDFHERLSKPLDDEKRREAALKVVRSA